MRRRSLMRTPRSAMPMASRAARSMRFVPTSARWRLRQHAPICAAREFLRSVAQRSEEHTSELQYLMRISYAVFCLKKKKTNRKLRYIVKHYKEEQDSRIH